MNSFSANWRDRVYHGFMLSMNRLSIVTAMLLATSAIAQTAEPETQTTTQTGDLRMTFKFKGDVPKPKPLEVPAICGNLDMLDETLIVNGNNKGIMNVVVYAYGGRDENRFPKFTARNKKLNLDCWNCRFVPRVTLAQRGDTLKVQNKDPIGYNTSFDFFKNDAINIALAPGNDKTVELEHTEPTVIPVVASIFPWMVGHVLVVDHPFYAVSNPDGVVTIRDLPVGEKMVFRAWHETGTFKEQIFVAGQETQWEANRFEVEIKSGMNDLGEIEIPGSAFGIK